MPSIADWLAENHAELITKTARREHRGVRTIEVEDIEQHVWKVLLGRASERTDYRTWERNGMANLFTKIAREYVARERIEYMHFAGAFIYTPGIVEVYLKDAVWANVEDVPDIDGRVDVRDALKLLPLATQQALFIHFGMDQPYTAGTAPYKRVMRAVDTISDRLNMSSGVQIADLADAA